MKDYYYYYISYDNLKNSLKTPYETEPTVQQPHPKRRPWTEDDEKSFVAELEAELDKVFTFQRVKSGEIVRRIKASEKEVNHVVNKLDQRGPRPSQSGNGRDIEDEDVPTEEDFMLLEEDLSDIIADVHDLAKFTQLNYTGFQKIIKKHDVGSGSYSCSGTIHERCANPRFSEANIVASETCLRCAPESEAFLQR